MPLKCCWPAALQAERDAGREARNQAALNWVSVFCCLRNGGARPAVSAQTAGAACPCMHLRPCDFWGPPSEPSSLTALSVEPLLLLLPRRRSCAAQSWRLWSLLQATMVLSALLMQYAIIPQSATQPCRGPGSSTVCHAN